MSQWFQHHSSLAKRFRAFHYDCSLWLDLQKKEIEKACELFSAMFVIVEREAVEWKLKGISVAAGQGNIVLRLWSDQLNYKWAISRSTFTPPPLLLAPSSIDKLVKIKPIHIQNQRYHMPMLPFPLITSYVFNHRQWSALNGGYRDI